MKRKWNAGVLAAVVAGLWAPCLGQVYQKNYQANPGQVLDRSPQVGSGGFNGGGGVAVNAYGNMVRDSSLYVQNQSTGLSGFHAPLPYSPSDQFQANLPSASLSDFRRQSVGLPDVMAGNTLSAAPYFDQSKTILKAPAIVGAYASPGTNVPRVPTVDVSVRATLNSKSYFDALADYKSVLPTRAGRELSVALQQGPTELYVPAALQGTTPGTAAEQFVPIMMGAVPGAGMLFELRDERDRSVLGQQFYEFLQARKLGEPNFVPSLGGKGRVEPNYAILQLDANIWRAGASGFGRPGEANAASMTPRENADIFMDVLERLRLKREGFGAGMAPPRLPEANAPLAGIVEISPNSQIIIHSLAGRGGDLANLNMMQAETKLKAGKFYEAAEAYEMAASLYERRKVPNPLPHVGRGLALLGAGEAASAAWEISAAFELFPPLMETRLDLGSLMGVSSLRSSLADLDERLKEPEPEGDPLLPFLACFLHYNQGDLEAAKLYAKQVQEGAAKSKVVKAFAEFVLTGKRPQAQTQPATMPGVAPEKAALTTPPLAP